MAEGNGIDIGVVYQLLTQVARTVERHDEAFVKRRADFGTLRGEFGALRQDVNAEIAGLRQTLTEDHASVRGPAS